MNKHRTILTWSILFLIFGYAMSFNIINVCMVPLVRHFSLTGASQGLMSSMINLGSMLPLFLAPLFQGRVDKLWLIIVSSFLQALMILLGGLSGSFSMLLTSCLLLGIAYSTTDTYVNSYMVDLYPRDSAKYLGLVHGFFGIGGLIVPILLNHVLAWGGWRSAYYIGALLFGLIALIFSVIALSVRKKADVPTAALEQPISRAMLGSYFKSSRNILLLLAGICFAAAQIGLVNWIVHYMSVRFEDAALGSVCLSLYWITTAFSRIFGPRLPFPAHKAQAVGALVSGILLMAGIARGSAMGMAVTCGLFGLFSGPCLPVLVGEAALGNADRTSLTTAVMMLLMSLSRMVTPLAMGSLTNVSLVAAMFVPAVAAILSALFSALANRGRDALVQKA